MAESAVIGVPHPDFGEGVTAVVVPRAGAALDESALRAALEQRLAKYKLPKRIVFVSEMPRNAMGKVQKAELRQRYRDLYNPARSRPVSDPALTATVIDGKAVAEHLRSRIAERTAALARQSIVPGLAVVLVGDDPASQVYVGSKTKQADAAGIRHFDHRLPGAARAPRS